MPYFLPEIAWYDALRLTERNCCEYRKKEITHDLLQEQLEKALNILKQRETGLFTWHIALNEALSELHDTLCPLFKKESR